MNGLVEIDLGTSAPSPNIALLLYRDLGVATVHRIRTLGCGDPQIGEGRLVGQDDLAALSRILNEQRGPSAFILGERVLGVGPNWLTWYAPAAVRPMLFTVAGERQHLDIMWPSLIFHAFEGTLYAVAYEGGERPNESTAVFLPPLMNFYDSTAMCRGSARYPNDYAESSIPAWEAAVFDTYFSHSNGHQKIAGCQCDDDHLRFWRHPARKKHPLKARNLILVSWAPTVGEWLKALHKDGGPDA